MREGNKNRNQWNKRGREVSTKPKIDKSPVLKGKKKAKDRRPKKLNLQTKQTNKQKIPHTTMMLWRLNR